MDKARPPPCSGPESGALGCANCSALSGIEAPLQKQSPKTERFTNSKRCMGSY